MPLEPSAYTTASSAEFCYPIFLYRVNCLKTIPFTAALTYIAHIWKYPPPLPSSSGSNPIISDVFSPELRSSVNTHELVATFFKSGVLISNLG